MAWRQAGGGLGPNFWKFQGGPYDYSHSGYAWAWQRRALDLIGGLFEDAGMGSGDHVMALALVGAAEKSFPGAVAAGLSQGGDDLAGAGADPCQPEARLRARHHRAFLARLQGAPSIVDRWDMFLEHGFDPSTDLKRNTFGVIEFAGNKPALEQAFDRYLRSREEDGNLAD